MEFKRINKENIDSEEFQHHTETLDNVLQFIGNTPLIKLNKIPQAAGIECDMYVKCEFFNAGGSVKDRIGKRMLEEAEKDGILKPGTTIIEPTSGNTGIGLALAAAVKGYRLIITLPEKMSHEKVAVLKALGAEIIRTPTEAPSESEHSNIGVAKRLNKEIPNSVVLDQYRNPYNPISHYDNTAVEILKQLDGHVDMFVAGAGTGGTITGTGSRLKKECPKVKIVAADPHGSILALPNSLNDRSEGYKMEGIGYDFIPDVLDRSVVDEWIKVDDKETFFMARKLIREEGILCGGSSGAALIAALQAAKSLKKGQKCVVLLPDSVRNYITKFLDDDWLKSNELLEEKELEGKKTEQWQAATIRDLNLRPVITAEEITLCKEVVKKMQILGFDQMPVTSSKTGKVVGLVTLDSILFKVSNGKAKLTSKISEVMIDFRKGESKEFVEITLDTRLDKLNTFFEKNSCAIISDSSSKVLHVCTKMDLMAYLVKNTSL